MKEGRMLRPLFVFFCCIVFVRPADPNFRQIKENKNEFQSVKKEFRLKIL
jgi:hypothetical protein